MRWRVRERYRVLRLCLELDGLRRVAIGCEVVLGFVCFGSRDFGLSGIEGF